MVVRVHPVMLGVIGTAQVEQVNQRLRHGPV